MRAQVARFPKNRTRTFFGQLLVLASAKTRKRHFALNLLSYFFA